MATTWRGIIWDLDGTLADTLRDITDAANAALASEGLAALPAASYRGLVGRGSRRLIEDAAKTLDLAAINRMHATFLDHYAQHALDHTKLYDGVEDVLHHYVSAGVPMSILSNKPHDFTLTVVDALLAWAPFVKVAGLRDGHARKPDPTDALAICERMGLEPAHLVLIGDSEVDMETAHRAGMGAVGVTWGFRDEGTLRSAGAELIVSRPAALRTIVATR